MFAQVLIFPHENILDCTGALQINAHSEKDSDSKFSISSVDEIKLTSRVPTEKPLHDGELKVALHHRKQHYKL